MEAQFIDWKFQDGQQARIIETGIVGTVLGSTEVGRSPEMQGVPKYKLQYLEDGDKKTGWYTGEELAAV